MTSLDASPERNPKSAERWRRPRVLALVQLPPPIHGASVMNRIVVESKVLNAAFEMIVEPIAAVDRLEDLRRFGVAKTWRGVRFLATVARRLWGARRPDLVYLAFSPRGFAFLRDLSAVALCRLAGVTHVLHLHGRGLEETVRRRPVFRMLARAILAKAYAVVLGERLLADVAQFVPRSRVKIVANGIPDPAPELATSMALNRPARDVPVVLFLGNMLREKGPTVLLEALAEVAKRGIPFRAVFAGAWRGDLTEREFHAIVRRLGLENVVLHHGSAYGDRKQALFGDADVFAFPSSYQNEAMPLVVLEAMAFQLPIVSTDIGSIADLVRNEETGMIVAAGDIGALARAITTLLADPARRSRMGRAARETFERCYTREHFETSLGRSLLEVHETALGESIISLRMRDRFAALLGRQ